MYLLRPARGISSKATSAYPDVSTAKRALLMKSAKVTTG